MINPAYDPAAATHHGCSSGRIELERELETSLGIAVDVLTPGSISPYLRDTIEAEAAPL